MQASWKSIQIYVEACKNVQSPKEDHRNSADAWGFSVQADQREERYFLRRAQSQAEVWLAGSKWEHAPLVKLLREISPHPRKTTTTTTKTIIQVGMDIKGLIYIWYLKGLGKNAGKLTTEENHSINILHCTGHLRLGADLRVHPWLLMASLYPQYRQLMM